MLVGRAGLYALGIAMSVAVGVGAARLVWPHRAEGNGDERIIGGASAVDPGVPDQADVDTAPTPAADVVVDERAPVVPEPPPDRSEAPGPAPNDHTEWLAGYWQWDEPIDAYSWVSGTWCDRTVVVAYAPPHPRREVITRAPAVGYVYLPGYWRCGWTWLRLEQRSLGPQSPRLRLRRPVVGEDQRSLGVAYARVDRSAARGERARREGGPSAPRARSGPAPQPGRPRRRVASPTRATSRGRTRVMERAQRGSMGASARTNRARCVERRLPTRLRRPRDTQTAEARERARQACDLEERAAEAHRAAAADEAERERARATAAAAARVNAPASAAERANEARAREHAPESEGAEHPQPKVRVATRASKSS